MKVDAAIGLARWCCQPHCNGQRFVTAPLRFAQPAKVSAVSPDCVMAMTSVCFSGAGFDSGIRWSTSTGMCANSSKDTRRRARHANSSAGGQNDSIHRSQLRDGHVQSAELGCGFFGIDAATQRVAPW
jgi:hypothetical protein